MQRHKKVGYTHLESVLLSQDNEDKLSASAVDAYNSSTFLRKPACTQSKILIVLQVVEEHRK